MICFKEIISEIAYLHLLLIRQFHMIFILMNHRKYITQDDTKSQLNTDYMKKFVVYGGIFIHSKTDNLNIQMHGKT